MEALGYDSLWVSDHVAIPWTIRSRYPYNPTGEFPQDVYFFAGISGDFAPLHGDEEFMRGTRCGRRIAHGALLVAYMSRASTAMCDGIGGMIVSYGFDRIAFPVRPSSATRSP